MAYQTRDDAYAPAYSKRFTSFAAQLVLAGTAPTSVAPTVAGQPIKHLPCQVIIEAGAAGHLDYIDSNGTMVPLTFAVAGTYGPYRMAPLSIEITTVLVAVTVFWQSPP